MTIENIFPTKIYNEKIGLPLTLKREVIKYAYDLKMLPSEQHQLIKNGFSSFNVHNSVLKEFKVLEDELNEHIKRYLKSVEFAEDHKQFSIVNSWVNIYPTGSYVVEHLHNGCYLSAVLFLQTPEYCGDFYLLDPLEYHKINNIGREENKHRFKPEEGRFILFPSYLKHGSMPNESKDDRVILSLNVKIESKYVQKTKETTV